MKSEAIGSVTPRVAAELAAALRSHEGPILITGPSPDPGAEAIRTEMEALARSRPRTVYVESLGGPRYRGLLGAVGAMVGNSSSGLIEASCVPLPVVNVGDRQRGRERGANVVDAPAERAAIAAALRHALSSAFRAEIAGRESPYGDGQAARRVVEVLASLPDRHRLLRKSFHTASPALEPA